MKLKIYTPTRKVIVVEAELTKTFSRLKQVIQLQEGLPPDSFIFSIRYGEKVSDSASLSDYQTNLHTLRIVPKHKLYFQIKCMTRDGLLMVSLDSSSTEYLEQLKPRIEQLSGLPSADQRLIWAGKSLHDGCPLYDFGFKRSSHKDDPCFLHLIMRYRSPPEKPAEE